MDLLKSTVLSTTFNDEKLITFYEENKKYFYQKMDSDKDAKYKEIKSYSKKQNTSFQLDLAPISSKNLEIIYKTKYYNRPPFQKEGSGNTISKLYFLFSRVINVSPIYYKTNTTIVKYPENLELHTSFSDMPTILQNIDNFLSYLDKAYKTNLLEIYEQIKSNIKPEFNFNPTNKDVNPNFNKIDFSEDKSINDNIIQILYKIGLINIDNYTINQALNDLAKQNILVINNIVYYFDVEKNKLIKINNLNLSYPGNNDKGIDPSTFCIGKYIEIIDINYDEDNYAYNFIYIDKNYNLTNLKSIDKSIQKIEMNRKRGHEGVDVDYSDDDYLDDDYYNKESNFHDFIKGDERTLKTKLKKFLPRAFTGTSNEFYNPYFTKYKDERFKIAMNSMSPFILNVLLNNKPFSKYIDKSKIFNSAQPELIKYLDPKHILNHEYLKYSFDTDSDFKNFNTYNTQFTIDMHEHKSTNTKNSTRKSTVEGGHWVNNSDILYHNLIEFFNSKSTLFIGFIYLPNTDKHENLCIIDKERNILIKYDPKGNSYNPFDLRAYFKYLLKELVSIRDSRDFVITNFLKQLPVMNYIDTSKLDSIHGFNFPQTGVKADSNTQTYILCAALLYCMNLDFPNDKTKTILKLTEADIKAHNDKILLLTEYGIRKEHAKYFRKELYTSILPMISNKDIPKFNVKNINYNDYYDMPDNLGFLKAVMDHQQNRFDELKFILKNNKNIKVIISGDKETGNHNLGIGHDVDDWKHTYGIDITKTGIDDILMYRELYNLIRNLIYAFPGRIEIGPIGRKGLKTAKPRLSRKKYTNYCREHIAVDDSPSHEVIHVWGANEENWNLDNFYENKEKNKTWDRTTPAEKDIYKINGTGQVDCLLYQSPGVFGIVTTLKNPKDISMLFNDTTNKIVEYIENTSNNNNNNGNTPNGKNTRVNTTRGNNTPRGKNTRVNTTRGNNTPRGNNNRGNTPNGNNTRGNNTRGYTTRGNNNRRTTKNTQNTK